MSEQASNNRHDASRIERLAQQLANGQLEPLAAAELDTLLCWLVGSEHADGERLAALLGKAGQRARLLDAVYRQLDEQLFVCNGDQLDVFAAHVHAEIDEKTRRQRFRRLMAAFHPDRSLNHGDWLTPRSQAIVAAYQSFRRSDPSPDTPSSASPSSAGTVAYPQRVRSSAQLSPTGEAFWPSVKQRLRRVENLPQKIMLALACVALTPFVIVAMADWLTPTRPSAQQAQRSASAETTVAQATMPVDADPTPIAESAAEAAPEPAPEPANATADRPAMAALPPEPDTEPEAAPDTLESVISDVAQLTAALVPQARTSPPPPSRQADRPAPQPPVTATQARPQAPALAATPPPEPVVSAPQGTASTARPAEPPANRAAQQAEPSIEQAPPADPAPPAVEPETAAPLLTSDEAEPTTVETMAAAMPIDTSEPEPVDQRIRETLQRYAGYFDRGNLTGFMEQLSDAPRENEHQGRRWFRDTYGQIFNESNYRQLLIDIERIEQTTTGWTAYAQFNLTVGYPGRRSTVRHQAKIRYHLIDDGSGRLLISGIEF